MSGVILGFFGPYRFLSNFHFADILYEGIVYPTTEHAYQAAKSLDVKQREYICGLAQPKEARRAGQLLTMRGDWDRVKLQVMEQVSRVKYDHDELKQMLLATGDAYLEETNTWGDTYWGVSGGRGQNNLGHLLMKIRKDLSQSIVQY